MNGICKTDSILKNYKFDFIVVGSGLAGLFAAITAAKHGTVALISKTEIKNSNSYKAQGGIAAAVDPEDSIHDHYKDTIEAGRGLCDEEAVKILVSDGVDRINDLIRMGMRFDDSFLGREGGHRNRRILHTIGGTTGKEVIDLLVWKAKQNRNVTIFQKLYVYDLKIVNQKCTGILVYNKDKNESCQFTGRTIIATGGSSGIYKRTTNPGIATGDGVALAFNRGAAVSDMEFLQFHPTAFHGNDGYTFLISEAVRGEGTLLLNASGERFMQEIHPLAELAPRDIVARSIFYELKKTQTDRVFLKFDQSRAEYLKIRFENIFNEVKKYGINAPEDVIPVAPAAHYLCGGIKTNLNAESTIKDLFVCGETAASGVHGANRLASNSLLECLVFAKRAVDEAKKRSISPSTDDYPSLEFDPAKEELFESGKNKLASLMTSNVGIVRNETSLSEAIKGIDEIQESVENKDEYYQHKLNLILTVGRLITNAAELRKGSRGAHYRDDFPDMNMEMNYHIIQRKNTEPMELPH